MLSHKHDRNSPELKLSSSIKLRHFTMQFLARTILFLSLGMFAYSQPTVFPSHQVNQNHTITFRYHDPSAKKVEVILGNYQHLLMKAGEDGVWSVTTPKLAPEIYDYYFQVDGDIRFDPANPDVIPSLYQARALVTVPGDHPMPWEPQQIPHGRIQEIFYTSHIIKGLPADQAPLVIYTPPGYEKLRFKRLPVLYLLHGFGGSAESWVETGRVNEMLDSLLAEKKIVPMIVVMPLSYGDLAILQAKDKDFFGTMGANTDLFTQSLVQEIIPLVERSYKVSRRRQNRALAGLSMGGQESLGGGLTHTGLFAWIGGFSPATRFSPTTNEQIAALTPEKARLHLLWIGSGKDEFFLEEDRVLIAQMRRQGFEVRSMELPGNHTWPVWRESFLDFAPRLFRPNSN